MPKGKFTTLTSWSYSVYTQYLKCPLSVCYDKVQKIRIKEPPNPHFVKGDRIHLNAETYVSKVGKPPKLTEGLEKFADRLAALRKAKARTELEWAFTRTLSPTGWFDNDAWLRMKIDACAETKAPPCVDIVDYKTGKLYEDHKQQRTIYALGGLQLVQIGALCNGDKDTKVTAAHLYTDTGFKAEETFTLKNLPSLKREWEARIKEMLADTVYKANPGRACRFCRFGKSKGGPCQQEKA